MSSFIFASKHNEEDMNAPLINKSIQSPSKNKIKDSVPFMNGSYDFSTVATNGEITYTERQILLSIGIATDTREYLYIWYTKIINWLMDSGKCQLIFDDMPDFYFLAEVESAPSFQEVITLGTLDVVFIAEPFKKGVNLEGSDIWDTFNFETDVVQDVEFDVSVSKTITIENVGRVVIPTVNCTSSMAVVNNGYTANFITGDNKDWNFKLQPGTNTIQITGTGHIKFIFRKELL